MSDRTPARVRGLEREAQVLQWQEHRASIQRQVDWLYSQRLGREVTRALRTLRRQLDDIDRAIAPRADHDVSQTTRAGQPRLPRP